MSQFMRTTAAVLALFACVIVCRRSAAGESAASHYSLEAETGAVLRPDGSVKRVPDILALPESAPKPGSIYELPGLKPGDVVAVPAPQSEPAPELERAAPAAQQDPSPPADPDTVSEPEAPEPGKPKPEKEPPPEPGHEKPQPSADVSAHPIPSQSAEALCPRTPLVKDISFTLDADSIEYDWCKKILRAENALYSNGGLFVRADEIRMDLNQGVLAAQGDAFVYTRFLDDFHYPADLIMLHLRTFEGRAVRRGQTFLFSAARMSRYEDWPDSSSAKQFSMYTVLEPAANVPSLSEIDDVLFVNVSPQALVTAQRAVMIPASQDNGGLTFHNVTYTNADGSPGDAPVFATRTGNLHEKGFTPRFVSVNEAPSYDYRLIQDSAEYIYAGNVHGKGYIRAYERHGWSSLSPGSSQYGLYSIQKQYIRGQNVLSLYADNDGDGSVMSGSASYYTFQNRGIQRFTYTANVTDYDSINANYRTNRVSAWVNHKRGPLLGTASLSSAHTGHESSGSNISYAMNSTYRMRDVDLALAREPFKIHGVPAYLSVSASLSWNRTLQDIELDYRNSFIGLRGYETEARDLDKSFSAILFGEPLALGHNAWFNFRGEFRYDSSYRNRDELRFVDGLIDSEGHSVQSNGREQALGRAGVTWAPLENVTLGAHYLASRYVRSGYGYWHGYIGYRGSERWSLRFNAIFEPEFTGSPWDYPGRLQSETAELVMAFPGDSWLTAVWDLDDRFLGTRLEQLRYVRDLRNAGRMQLEFVMSKSETKYYGVYPMYYYLGIHFH